MKESTRKYDKRCETIVSQFLDMYFYKGERENPIPLGLGRERTN